jgi:hypothetical protein
MAIGGSRSRPVQSTCGDAQGFRQSDEVFLLAKNVGDDVNAKDFHMPAV